MQACKSISSYLIERQKRLTKTLSRQRPLPSMLLLMPDSLSRSVKAAQQSAGGERILQVQLIDLALPLRPAVRLRLVIHAAAADPEQARLLLKGQPVAGVDHLFALKRPGFVSALSKKSRAGAITNFCAAWGMKSLLQSCARTWQSLPNRLGAKHSHP